MGNILAIYWILAWAIYEEYIGKRFPTFPQYRARAHHPILSPYVANFMQPMCCQYIANILSAHVLAICCQYFRDGYRLDNLFLFLFSRFKIFISYKKSFNERIAKNSESQITGHQKQGKPCYLDSS